jgi:tetratricopeptide (TPR) repeat protein
MKKAAALVLTVLMLQTIAAAADPAGDYAALVTAARDGDPGTDYTAMRQAYAMIAEYDPFGEKTNALMRDGQAAYVAKDCKTALERFKAAIALNFTLSDAHALSADCLEQAGDKAGEAREEAIAQGLFNSLIGSGDGNSPATAFRIVTMHEETVILAVAGVNGTKKTTITTDQGPVEKIDITDQETGKKGAVYFNTGVVVLASAMQKAKPRAPAKP